MLAAAKIRLKMMLKKRSPNNLLTKIVLLAWILSGSKALFAAEDDLYDYLWLDPDKKVYVLQNKVYKKKSKYHSVFPFRSQNLFPISNLNKKLNYIFLSYIKTVIIHYFDLKKPKEIFPKAFEYICKDIISIPCQIFHFLRDWALKIY
jgi:hypothetical protein